MIWKSIGLAIVILFSAGSVLAAPVQIRAGEHEAFTRVVLELPEGVTWNLDIQSRDVTLFFNPFQDGFDTSEVFAIIPKTRLIEVSSDRDTVEFQLGCECTIDTFIEQDRFLVLDIKGVADPQLGQSPPNSKPTTALAESEFGYGDLLWRQDPMPMASANSEAQQIADNENPIPREQVKPQNNNLSNDPRMQNLLRAFSDASTKGLINVERADPLFSENETNLDSDASETLDNHSERLEGGVGITNRSQLVISDSGQFHGVDDAVMTPEACPDPAIVQVSNWGTDASFSDQIRLAESQLFDETGTFRADKIRTVVELYLYFGLGAEAIQAASLSETFAQEYPQLMDIAGIMEFGYSRNPRVLHTFQDCPSDLALWAAMSTSVLSPESKEVTASILKTLEKLPKHLRSFIGSELSERFARSNMTDEAGIAQRSSDRAAENGEDSVSLSDALIVQQTGASETFEGLLETVVEQGGDDAAEALLELVESQIARKQKIDADLALAVEAFAFENRKSRLGAELAKTHVVASAGSGQFTKAMAAINELEGQLDPLGFSELKTRFLALLTENAEDLVFLEHVFGSYRFGEDDLTAHVAFLAAERLFSLGFIDAAEQAALFVASRGTEKGANLLLAEIMIEKKNPNSALLYLEGNDSEEARLLRAKAYVLLEDHTNAVREYAAVDRGSDAARAAWLSGDWLELLSENDPVFGPSLAMALEETEFDAQSDAFLERAENILISSSNARNTIETLLYETAEDE